MKEVIRQIKKGNLRFYTTLVEKYIGLVYSEAKNKYGESQATEITLDVFVTLYKDIKGSLKWQNADNLVVNSITKTCKKHKIKFNNNEKTNVQVPPIIMRKLFVELSNNVRIRKYKVAVVIVLIIAMFFCTMFLDLNTLFSNKTVYNYNPSKEIVYELSYNDINGLVTNITNLQDKGVLVDMYRNNIHSCEIWYLGKKLNNFEIPKHQIFQYGLFESDSLVFKDSKSLYQYSINGELKNVMNIEGSEVAESENKRFLVISQKNNDNRIIDLEKFKFVNEVQGTVITISNNGYVITNNDNIHETVSTEGVNKQIVCLQAFSYDKAVVVYSNGEVALYDNEILEWSKPVTIPKKVQKELGKNSLVKKAYVFANDDTVNIVMEYDKRFILQSFNTLDGTERLNTIDSLQVGSILKKPSISPDHKMICLESALRGYYPIDSVNFVDMSTFPMKKIYVDEEKLLGWACEIEKDDRYMYFSGDSALKVVKMNFIN